jgi:hypothetical protein
MPGTLPPILPISGSNVGPLRPSVGRNAGNLSVSRLAQHEERGQAKVSAAQVVSSAKGGSYKKSTSVFHPDGAASATGSVAHAGQQTVSSFSDIGDAEREEKRFDFARRKILEKKFEEHKTMKNHVGSVFGSHAQKKPRMFMNGLMEKHKESKRIGMRYSKKTRAMMRMEIDRARRKGEFGSDDAKVMKDLVERIH